MSNKQSLGACGGFSSHSKQGRVYEDLYTTDQGDFIRFLDALGRDGVRLYDNILEPSAGLGDLSLVLEKRGHAVHSFDKVLYPNQLPLAQSIREADFLYTDFRRCGAAQVRTVLTNPPFKHAEQFLERAFEVLPLAEGNKVVFLLRLQFLESLRRKRLFEKHPLRYVYVYRGKAVCYRYGVPAKREGAVCFAWFVWEYTDLDDCASEKSSEPIIRWID